MVEYREVFVAFDVAKTKHAVVIADGGRGGDVRFFGDISSAPAAVERLVRDLRRNRRQLWSVLLRHRRVYSVTGVSADPIHVRPARRNLDQQLFQAASGAARRPRSHRSPPERRSAAPHDQSPALPANADARASKGR
jgi:hypothetical protein